MLLIQTQLSIAPKSLLPAIGSLSPDERLVMLDTAKASLASLNRVDAVKDLRDKAQAIQAYMKQSGDSLELQNSAAEVKIRAERRIGELLAEMPKNTGAQGVGPSPEALRLQSATAMPTLADMGIEKTLAHRCQKAATIPEPVFETYIQSTKEQKDELTSAGVQKIAKAQELRIVKESFVNLAKSDAVVAEVSQVDAIAFLSTLGPASADLLITDPPYMTDVDDIQAFAHGWLPLALSRLKSTARAYVCIGAYPDELLAYLTAPRAGFELSQVLSWTYRNTLGPSPSHDYKLNWQAVLYFRGPDAPPLDCPVMNEQFSVQDINAPDGRLANRFHEWQKPDELAERFIRHSTQVGQTVIDPFAGTGTFLAAASRLGRLGCGSELDGGQIDLCQRRGIAIAGHRAIAGRGD